MTDLSSTNVVPNQTTNPHPLRRIARRPGLIAALLLLAAGGAAHLRPLAAQVPPVSLEVLSGGSPSAN
jgi:hypothetical protein